MTETTESPALNIKNCQASFPLIQGGMGVGVSLAPLAAAVANEGGIGIISSACLDRLVSRRTGQKLDSYQAMIEEVALARRLCTGGLIGVNIMFALQRDFEASVRGAIDVGADLIICGAGLPLNLPAIKNPGRTALVPIVSSARALELICKKWEKLGYRPDAAVLEGPLAGGHLGFKIETVDDPNNRLEVLLPQVLETAHQFGDFPIIAAGGIFDRSDIMSCLDQGAAGVQMGTRFLVAVESSATLDYKLAAIKATTEDLVVATDPGSPCGLPFRLISSSTMYQQALSGRCQPLCDKGYVLQRDKDGHFTQCPAKIDANRHFCICNGLLNSAGYQDDPRGSLYTVGTNAYRLEKIEPVHIIMNQLKGLA
ncbi:nitronate monooxygenase [Candidatus Falkowbacteria bacterium]|nr:nitronate monooxygenase [Candidatus Falkowbacteria bacterium]